MYGPRASSLLLAGRAAVLADPFALLELAPLVLVQLAVADFLSVDDPARLDLPMSRLPVVVAAASKAVFCNLVSNRAGTNAVAASAAAKNLPPSRDSVMVADGSVAALEAVLVQANSACLDSVPEVASDKLPSTRLALFANRVLCILADVAVLSLLDRAVSDTILDR